MTGDACIELDRYTEAHAEQVAEEGAAAARANGLEAVSRAVQARGNIWATLVRDAAEDPPAAIVLGSRQDGTANLVVNFDQSVADRLPAGDVVKQIAPIVGGGGGGRPTMARAGGKEPERLGEALARARELISAALTAA